MTCPANNELVEQRIDRVLTQYRESPKLLGMMRTYLRQVEIVVQTICDMPSYFDIETAVGDQLTLLGKRLGWPRCHCVCEVPPVFGFVCADVPSAYPIAGFCDANATWSDCGTFGISEICLNDDEMYRLFLKVRRYQMLARYDLASLEEAAKIFWGDTARVLDAGNGRVIVQFGRTLTAAETQVLKLYPRVMPIAPGIKLLFHFGVLRVFGFGEGWGGFCEMEEGSEPFDISTSSGDLWVDDLGNQIVTSPLALTEWMCGIDVRPYEC